jgi:hypothetical protein
MTLYLNTEDLIRLPGQGYSTDQGVATEVYGSGAELWLGGRKLNILGKNSTSVPIG